MEVQKVTTYWVGDLMIGVTEVNPSYAVQLRSAKDLVAGTIIANGNTFNVNGKEVMFP